MNINLILENIRKHKPIVHCITNYVTVNDVANTILAIGASPIMADDKKEVGEITSISNALVINIGTLNERTIESMILAGKTANKLNIPIVLDPVGVGASQLRNETIKTLLEQIKFTVIKANISELKAICGLSIKTRGVDAEENDDLNLQNKVKIIKQINNNYNCIVVMTGSTDIVCDNEEIWTINNGHSNMSKITGTGCMLGGLIGAFIAPNMNNRLHSVIGAVSTMGIAGEISNNKIKELNLGTGSYRTIIIDSISNINESIFNKLAKINIYNNE